MKRAFSVAGIAVLGVSVAYLVTIVQAGFTELPEIDWTPSALASIGVGIGLYVVATFVWSGGWAALLAAVGQPVNVVGAFSIIGTSQITKYLPGNIAHHIGRAAVAANFGLGSVGVVLSMALEFFLMAAAAIACALLALGLTNSGAASDLMPLGNAALGALIVGALAIPIGAMAAARKWGSRFLSRQAAEQGTHAPDIARSSLNFLAHFVTFLLHGVILLFLARGVFDLSFSNYWLGVGSFGLAFVAGFLAPGIPAGLGVREAVLVAGLSLEMGAGSALAVATAHRIINIVGDGVVFGIALYARRFIQPRSVPAP